MYLCLFMCVCVCVCVVCPLFHCYYQVVAATIYIEQSYTHEMIMCTPKLLFKHNFPATNSEMGAIECRLQSTAANFKQ